MTQIAINPFATRYVRPGQLAWIGDGPHSLSKLVDTFTLELHCRAAIVGPHGTGKSTLLAHMIPLLGYVAYHQPLNLTSCFLTADAAGETDAFLGRNYRPAPTEPRMRAIVWLALRRHKTPAFKPTVVGSTAPPTTPVGQLWRSRSHWKRDGLLVIDGFEQLPKPMQWLTIGLTRRRRMGLLVTTHRSVPLRPLLKTKPSLELAKRLVMQVFENHCGPVPEGLIDERLLQCLLNEEQGNLREVLMRLYDIAGCDLPS